MMELILFIVLGASLALTGFLFWRKTDGKETMQYQKAQFLNDGEREFFLRLNKALPGTHIFPKIAVSVLLEPKQSSEKSRAVRRPAQFEKISQERLDYLICDGALKLLCVVQLDDGSGDPEQRLIVDRYLASAGIRIIHWNMESKPTIEQIAKAILPMTNKPTFKPDLAASELNTVQRIYEADPVPSNINGLSSATLDQLTPDKVLKNTYPHIWQRICLFAPEPKHLQKYLLSLSMQDRGEKRAGFSQAALKEIADVQFENDRFLAKPVTAWQPAFVNR